jgi:predicted nucleic acid-binding Zn ribbon protein
MRRSIPSRIGDLLGEYVRVNRFDVKLMEVDAIEYWGELMKPVFSRYCREVTVQNGVLYAEITSSVVKAELHMMRESLREKINSRLGYEMIQKIVFR